MKSRKLIGLGLILVIAILYSEFVLNEPDQITEPYKPELYPVVIQADEFAFKCDGRQYCSQMTSYEEAKFFLMNCPDTKMDGDNDGEPCERQF